MSSRYMSLLTQLMGIQSSFSNILSALELMRYTEALFATDNYVISIIDFELSKLVPYGGDGPSDFHLFGIKSGDLGSSNSCSSICDIGNRSRVGFSGSVSLLFYSSASVIATL